MPTSNSTYPVHQSPLYKLSSRSKLARILRLSNRDLRHLAAQSPKLYREWDEPKKSGKGMRHIEDPAFVLKKTQRVLANLLARITPPDYLFCPVRGRDYILNAAQHRGNRVVRCLDLKEYFPSTPARRVFWYFHTVMKCERDIAGTLVSIACFNDHLPTGSPLSPILAHYAYSDVWSEIAAICNDHALILTVYIDDITISGRSVPQRLIWPIKKLIHGAGLYYHKEKLYIDTAAEVTGVIVKGYSIIAPHRQFKKIRQTETELDISRDPREARKRVDKLAGLRGQVGQIESLMRELAAPAS